MIDRKQFREIVIDPTLEELGLYSIAASELMLGTALQESRLTYIVQLDGDANFFDDGLGVYQTERKTIEDIWKNWLRYRIEFSEKVLSICNYKKQPDPSEVVWNLRYATVMARLHYRRVAEPLPPAGDLQGQAAYWKKHYNRGGKGSVMQYVDNWSAR